MSIINLKKQSLVYTVVSLLLIAFNYIYSLFSHGISSDAMSGMWRYALIMAIFYGASSQLNTQPLTSLRPMVFTINCGIATIISGLLLTGIVEIAGTNSAFIPYFFYIGWGLVIIGLLTGGVRLGRQAKID